MESRLVRVKQHTLPSTSRSKILLRDDAPLLLSSIKGHLSQCLYFVLLGEQFSGCRHCLLKEKPCRSSLGLTGDGRLSPACGIVSKQLFPDKKGPIPSIHQGHTSVRSRYFLLTAQIHQTSAKQSLCSTQSDPHVCVLALL